MKSSQDGKVVVQKKQKERAPADKLRGKPKPGSRTPGAEKPSGTIKKEKNPNTE